MNKIYKFIAFSIAAAFIAILIFISVSLFAYSHKIYPDAWLKIEEKTGSFIQKVTFPIKIARLSWRPPDEHLIMPVYGVLVREIADSWQAPRPDDRQHEGQDIFAARGTPIFSATYGYVTKIGEGELGGKFVYVTGNGGVRYYYAHLDRIAEELKIGQEVSTDTVLGFVGNTGNAENTPYHLHFGMYRMRKALNPLPLLINRPRY